MYDNNKTLQQKYDITYVGDGYYKIKSKQSNKVLAVESTNPRVGSTIQQQDDQNLETQKWILKKYSESVYAIISKCGNLYISLTNTNIQNGQNLQLKGQTDLQEQRFILINETPKQGITHNIENGTYQLITKGNKTVDITGSSSSNSANVEIWDNAKTANQKFQITRIDNTDYYKITAVHSLKSLDVQNSNTNTGANIIQNTYSGASNQQWLIKDCGSGWYNIISKESGLCLDITSGQVSKSGANVELWYSNGADAQKFQLLKTNIINNDSYRISSQANSSKFFDVNGSSQADSANVQLWQKNGDNNQIFRVESEDYVNYKIIARHSNKVLTVGANNNVVQATDTNSDNQKWIIESIGNQYYKIKSKSTNLYLSINGTNVEVAKANNSSSQKFKFNDLERKKGIDVSEWNGSINWDYVKKSGIDYAIIRIGYRGYVTGAFAEDKFFRENIKGAKRAGLKVGIYFFSQAVNEAEAREEANWTVNKLKEVGYANSIDYPIATDIESSGGNPGRADNISKQTRTNVAKAFCETIKANGYRPMVYSNKNWFYNYIDVNQLNQYNIWMAHYTYSPDKPSDYKYHYEIWQYTSVGQVMGIQGNVDMDICYQSY